MSLDDEFYGYEEIAKRILFEIGALACCDAHDAIKSNIDNYGGNCSLDCPYCE